jgi:hypothetical protein
LANGDWRIRRNHVRSKALSDLHSVVLFVAPSLTLRPHRSSCFLSVVLVFIGSSWSHAVVSFISSTAFVFHISTLMASNDALLSFLESIGCSSYASQLRSAGVGTVEGLAQASDEQLLQAGIPLGTSRICYCTDAMKPGPAMKLVSEVQKHRLREMLAGTLLTSDLVHALGRPKGGVILRAKLPRRLRGAKGC